TITIGISQNDAFTARSGSVGVAGTTVVVTQAGAACTTTVNPRTRLVTAPAGTGILQVSTTFGDCPRSVSSSASWLTITSGGSTTGSGALGYAFNANHGAVRTATITVN